MRLVGFRKIVFVFMAFTDGWALKYRNALAIFPQPLGTVNCPCGPRRQSFTTFCWSQFLLRTISSAIFGWVGTMYGTGPRERTVHLGHELMSCHKANRWEAEEKVCRWLNDSFSLYRCRAGSLRIGVRLNRTKLTLTKSHIVRAWWRLPKNVLRRFSVRWKHGEKNS